MWYICYWSKVKQTALGRTGRVRRVERLENRFYIQHSSVPVVGRGRYSAGNLPLPLFLFPATDPHHAHCRHAARTFRSPSPRITFVSAVVAQWSRLSSAAARQRRSAIGCYRTARKLVFQKIRRKSLAVFPTAAARENHVLLATMRNIENGLHSFVIVFLSSSRRHRCDWARAEIVNLWHSHIFLVTPEIVQKLSFVVKKKNKIKVIKVTTD